jgi:hypothetical protein
MDDDFAKSMDPVEINVRIIATKEDPTPMSPAAIICGIVGAVAIMVIGTSVFAWTRKRT